MSFFLSRSCSPTTPPTYSHKFLPIRIALSNHRRIHPAVASRSSSSTTILDRVLYRSLLRASQPFSAKPHGPILCSLLHRTGLSCHDDLFQNRVTQPLASGKADDEEETEEVKRTRLSPDEARDLTRGYNELQRIRYDRGDRGDLDSDERKEDFDIGTDPHVILYRRLVRDIIGGRNGVVNSVDELFSSPTNTMDFPGNILNKYECWDEKDGADGGPMKRLQQIIRHEFRATSQDEAFSHSINFTHTDRQYAAMLGIKELNSKLSYARSLGWNKDNDEQAEVVKNNKAKYHRQAAKDVIPVILPSNSSDCISSFLKSKSGGTPSTTTYLVANPNLDGYFAKSVIVLLEHSEPNIQDETKPPRTDNDDDDDGTLLEENIGSSGGTYGLVVNKQSRVQSPVQNFSSSTSSPSSSRLATFQLSPTHHRPRSLREVIQTTNSPSLLSSLPSSSLFLLDAFGDCPIREGGPVNMSVQMIRGSSWELEERLQIGGVALPSSSSEQLQGKQDKERIQQNESVVSTNEDAEMSPSQLVYFRGDLMRAAQAVMSGDMDQDDFSFVIGASCWEYGQLANEISKGYWSLCTGPSSIALTGMCDHEEVDEKDSGNDDDLGGRNYSMTDKQGGDESSSASSSPSDRPKSNLWLSMMCALGEEEAKLAHLIIEKDERIDDDDDDDDNFNDDDEACDRWE